MQETSIKVQKIIQYKKEMSRLGDARNTEEERLF